MTLRDLTSAQLAQFRKKCKEEYDIQVSSRQIKNAEANEKLWQVAFSAGLKAVLAQISKLK